MFLYFVQAAKAIEHPSRHFKVVLLQPFFEYFLSLLLYFACFLAQNRQYLALRLSGRHKVNPRLFHTLRLRCEYLYLVAALQFVAQRHEFVVHLRTNAVAANERVYLESEVESGATRWHHFDFAFWCKYKYFGSKEVQLDGIEEIHCVGLWVVEYFLYGVQPIVQFSLVLSYLCAFLILPMGGKTLLSNLVHTVGTYLNFYPLTQLGHQCNVQSLVAVGFRVVHPIAQTVGVALVELADCHINLETFVGFFFPALGLKDDANG